MSPAKQVAILLTTATVVIGGFFLLKPNDKTASDSNKQTAQKTAAKSTNDKTETAGKLTTGTNTIPLLEAGKFKTITVHKGDTVKFKAWSKVPEEIHVHGYDILNKIPAGKRITVDFHANKEGVFEIELHGSDTKVAKLKVLP